MTAARTNTLGTLFWLVTAAAFTGAVALAFAYAPVERSMGIVQKIFYLHLPVAINTFLAFMVCFVASVGYLWQRRACWDDLADAAARVGVLLCSVVLLTGMLWGKAAWGQWWTWSPRLTFSLVLWLLYVVYLLVRGSIESTDRRALVGAVYGVIAFLDVPLVYLSARLMPDIHPASVSLAGPMKVALAAMFVPVTLMTAGLIVARFRLARHRAAAGAAHEIEAAAAPKPMNVRFDGGLI